MSDTHIRYSGKDFAVMSGKQRHGRRFEPTHELGLVDDALAACRTLPGAASGLIVLAESPGPYGIPDFLAVIGSGERLRARLALDVSPIVNEMDASLVAATHTNRSLSPQSLARKLGWSEPLVKSRIEPLRRAGALQVSNTGAVTKPAGLDSIGRLIAIEMKIENWKRAIRQGRRYQVWADSYVLVMPELANSVYAQAKEAVASDRSGLVAGGRWIVRPSGLLPNPGHRFWGSEYAIASLASYQPSPIP